jgi:hypothetical protein
MDSLPRLLAPGTHRRVSGWWMAACLAIVVTLLLGGLAGLDRLARAPLPLPAQGAAPPDVASGEVNHAAAAATALSGWPAPAADADDGRELPPTF